LKEGARKMGASGNKGTLQDVENRTSRERRGSKRETKKS